MPNNEIEPPHRVPAWRTRSRQGRSGAASVSRSEAQGANIEGGSAWPPYVLPAPTSDAQPAVQRRSARTERATRGRPPPGVGTMRLTNVHGEAAGAVGEAGREPRVQRRDGRRRRKASRANVSGRVMLRECELALKRVHVSDPFELRRRSWSAKARYARGRSRSVCMQMRLCPRLVASIAVVDRSCSTRYADMAFVMRVSKGRDRSASSRANVDASTCSVSGATMRLKNPQRSPLPRFPPNRPVYSPARRRDRDR